MYYTIHKRWFKYTSLWQNGEKFGIVEIRDSIHAMAVTETLIKHWHFLHSQWYSLWMYQLDQFSWGMNHFSICRNHVSKSCLTSKFNSRLIWAAITSFIKTEISWNFLHSFLWWTYWFLEFFSEQRIQNKLYFYCLLL